jgi:RNA polymerase sigma-70 factor (ECF subfamily)
VREISLGELSMCAASPAIEAVSGQCLRSLVCVWDRRDPASAGTAKRLPNLWAGVRSLASARGRARLLPANAELDDPSLVKGVQAGDRAAISRVLELGLPLMRWVVARSDLSREDAEDVVQEARVGFLEAALRFDGRSRLSTYLVQITCHKCADVIRARRRRSPDSVPLDDEQAIGVTDEALDDLLTRLAVTDAVAQLSPRQRRVVELRIAQRKSYKEIAADMGVAVGTVGGMISDALLKLRELLSEDVAPEPSTSK